MIAVMIFDFGMKYIMILYFTMLVSNYSTFYVFIILNGYSEKFTRNI